MSKQWNRRTLLMLAGVTLVNSQPISARGMGGLQDSDAGTSRSNPAKLGAEVLSGDIGITALEFLRGPAAHDLVMMANPYNPVLPDELEYVVVRVRVRNAGSIPIPQTNILAYDDWGVTGSANVIRPVGTVAPKPAMETIEPQSLLPGGEVEGWLAKRVGTGETNLELVFFSRQLAGGLSNAELRYIALEEGAQLPVPTTPVTLPDTGASDAGASRNKPAEPGTTVTIEPYAVEMLGSARGSEALALLHESGSTETPSADNEFVLVNVRVTNIGQSDAPLIAFDYALFTLSGSASVVHDPALNVLTTITRQNPLALLTALHAWLYPTGQTEGWVLFEVTDGETDLVLELKPVNQEDARYLVVE